LKYGVKKMVIKYHVLHCLKVKVKIKSYRVIQVLIIHTQKTQNTKNIYKIIRYNSKLK